MAGSLRSVLLERDMARRLQEYHTPPPMEASSSSSDIPALSDPCLVVGTEYLSKAGDKGRQQQIACATAALLAASARVPPPLPPEEPSQDASSPSARSGKSSPSGSRARHVSRSPKHGGRSPSRGRASSSQPSSSSVRGSGSGGAAAAVSSGRSSSRSGPPPMFPGPAPVLPVWEAPSSAAAAPSAPAAPPSERPPATAGTANSLGGQHPPPASAAASGSGGGSGVVEAEEEGGEVVPLLLPTPHASAPPALWGGRTAEEWARSGHARQAYDWPVVSEFKGKAQWRAGRLYNIGTVVAGEEDDNCCDLSYEVVVSGAGRESFSGSPVNDAGLLQAAAEEEQVQALQEQEQELNSEQAACDDLYGITEEGDDEDEDCRDDAQFSTAALALLPRRGGGQGQSWGQASTRPAQGQYMLTEWHHSHSPAGGQAQGAAQQPRAGQRRVWSASPSSGMRASSGSSSSGGSSSGMVGTRVARQAQLLSVYHHRPTSAPTPTTGATGTTASGAMVASCGAHLAWVGAYPGADKLCRVRPSVAAARPYSCGGSRGSEVAWGVNGRPGSGFRNMVGSLDALSDDLKAAHLNASAYGGTVPAGSVPASPSGSGRPSSGCAGIGMGSGIRSGSGGGRPCSAGAGAGFGSGSGSAGGHMGSAGASFGSGHGSGSGRVDAAGRASSLPQPTPWSSVGGTTTSLPGSVRRALPARASSARPASAVRNQVGGAVSSAAAALARGQSPYLPDSPTRQQQQQQQRIGGPGAAGSSVTTVRPSSATQR